MSKERRLHGVGHAPDHGLHQDGIVHPQKVLQKQPVKPQDVPQAQPQLFVDPEDIDEHQNELQNAGGQRTDGGASNAQLGKAKSAGDQQKIDAAVDHQRHGRDDQCQPDRLHTAHRAEQNRRHGKKQISKANDLQILHTLGDNRRIIHKKVHQPLRTERGQHKHAQGKQNLHPKADGGQRADRFQTLLPPILAGEDNHAVIEPIDDLLHDELDHVDGRDTGKRRFRVAADHHVICQIDAEDHGLFQNQRPGQTPEQPVKGPIADHNRASIAVLRFRVASGRQAPHGSLVQHPAVWRSLSRFRIRTPTGPEYNNRAHSIKSDIGNQELSEAL